MASRKENSIKWYQLSVSEMLNLALNQGLRLSLAAWAALTALFMATVKMLKNPVGLALMILVPISVFAIHHVAMNRVAARMPPHLNEMVEELLSIRIPTGKVVPNHANTKLLYVKTTTNDTWALYLTDIASRKTTMIFDIKLVGGEGVANNRLEILGWSPGDEYFAYLRNSRKTVAICDGVSGAELNQANMSVEAPAKKAKQNNKKNAKPKQRPIFVKEKVASTNEDLVSARGNTVLTNEDIIVSTNGNLVSTKVNPVSTSAWLSSRSLLCSDGYQIVEFSPATNNWGKTLFYDPPRAVAVTNLLTDNDAPSASPPAKKAKPAAKKKAIKPAAGEIKSLAVVDWDSVLWQQSNSIYYCKSGGKADLIWEATNCDLMEFSYSAKADKFLLHCQDKAGEFLAEYYPHPTSGQEIFTTVTRLDASEYQPVEAQLVNDAKGYAYLNLSEFSASQLVIKLTDSSPPIKLPWDEIVGFSINGLQLYGIATKNNEPPGIWRCDLASGVADCLVASIDQPFKYAVSAPAVEASVTNAAGERLPYYLLEPVKSGGNSKHPMVVFSMGGAQRGGLWNRFSQIVANSGGYALCMNRQKRSYDKWADDAFCAYAYLSQKYAVDTNNAYLVGVSIGSQTAISLMESKPEAWKGAFLFSTLRFPNLAQNHVQTIVLDVGGQDVGKRVDKLLESQDKLAAGGVRPILMIHPDGGHIVRSTSLDRERMKQFAAFIRQP